MLLAMAAAVAACSRLPRKPLVRVPPEGLGAWRRAAMATLDPVGAPEPAAGLRPVQWVQLAYSSGVRIIGVTAFAFTTDASAFELQQKWNRGTGDVTYRKNSIFVVCRSETESAQELAAFARRLEQEWP